MLTVSRCDVIGAVLDAVLDDESIVVVRIKDRFNAPSGGGWRDVMINYYHKSDAAKHVCELQLVHAPLLTARKGLPGHAIYNVVRNATEVLELLLGGATEERGPAMRELVRCPGGVKIALSLGAGKADLLAAGVTAAQLVRGPRRAGARAGGEDDARGPHA
jgi:hypothetical protein